MVPVARICAVEHSTGQSFPTGWATGWRIMTMTSWVGGFAFFVDDAAARQFLQSPNALFSVTGINRHWMITCQLMPRSS